jgi:amino acid adenylation domain-containing protein/thioester reductase-like protein
MQHTSVRVFCCLWRKYHRNSYFVIRHSSFVLRHSSFVPRNLMLREAMLLTNAQKRAFRESEVGVNRCVVYRLDSELDVESLARSIRSVIDRTLPLSYRYLRIDGDHRIIPIDDHDHSLTVHAIDGLSGEDIHALIDNVCKSPFRLDGGAPYHFSVLHGSSYSYVVFACHHALLDQHSLYLLLNSIASAYAGIEINRSLGLPQDLVLKLEAELVASPLYDDNLRFWLKIVHDASFVWRPGRNENLLDGTQYFELTLDQSSTAKLVSCASELSTGLTELLTTAFHVFLGTMTRTNTVLTSRNHRLFRNQVQGIGFNEHRVIHKTVLEQGDTLRQLIQRSSALYQRAQYRGDVVADDVFKELKLHDQEDRLITNVYFDESPLRFTVSMPNGVVTSILPRYSQQLGVEDINVQYDLQECLSFYCMTRSAQDAAGLRQAFEQFMVMLTHLPDELDKPIDTLTLMNDELRARALELAEGGPLARDAEDVLVGFARTARSTPSAPALRCADRVLTYEEVYNDVGSIAASLRPLIDGIDEPLVGICLSRSEKMVEALYGVLAAGAGYLPLDPSMPAERLSFIASDSKLAALIVDASTAHIATVMPEVPARTIDEVLASPQPMPEPRPLTEVGNKTAYVIYTSGTTGKPKGVVLERNMLAHFDAMLHGQWERGAGTRWLQFASINFDASILELFSPLVHGGELVVAQSEERTDPEAVFSLLVKHSITHAFLPPAMLRLLPRRPLAALEVVFAGGEAMDEETVRYWSKMVELVNIYGPTETTVFCNANVMKGYKAAAHLGKPMPGYKTYILCDNEQLAPIGAIGELVVGGPAVAREYLGRPELNAVKFRPNPYAPGRMYHTGDLARFLPNGEIEFLGRMDFQVKIRGFRIELGDIEAMIGEQPEVRGVFVGAFDVRGQKSLIAWYLSTGLSADVLRDRLAQKLPPYMVPSYLIPIDEFPVNVSGKVDRTRLPMPDGDAAPVAERQLDELEQHVRQVWARYLNIDERTVGPDTNFFHSGGHSLTAALVCNNLSTALGTDIRPKQLFSAPTLSDFARIVRGAPATKQELPTLHAVGSTSSVLRDRLVDLIHSRALHIKGDTTYNIVVRIDFSEQINPLQLRRALSELVAADPIFRTQFEQRDGETFIVASDKPLPTITISDGTHEMIDRRVEELRSHVIHLDRAPLWTAEIIGVPEGTCSLLMNIHHAIFDGWSLTLFIEELSHRYQGETVTERISWIDYHNWAQHLYTSDAFDESCTYWREKLKGMEAHIELPVDMRQKEPNANASHAIRIGPTVVAALKKYADDHSITLSPVFFALYLTWLWRLTGKEDLACTYPYAGREVPGSENIYGMFVKMGVILQSINPKGSLHDLVAAVHKQMLDDKEHLLASPHDADVSGLEKINVTFSLQSGIGLEGAFGNGTMKASELPSKTSKADITGIFYQALDGGIEGRIEFDSSLFHVQSIEKFVEVFTALINSAAQDPMLRVCDLTYMSDAAQSRVMSMAIGSPVTTPEMSIPQRFAEIVAAFPDNTAVIFNGLRMTYRELDERSSAIAHGLLHHASPGARVGLSILKSDTLIAAMLGILKAGCAYVPLDSSYPTDRVQYFVKNAAVDTVIADATSREKLIAMDLGHLTFLDPTQMTNTSGSPLPAVSPTDLAYIIHTSGSTGLPKGVMIEHHSVVRLIVSSKDVLEYDETSVGTLGASTNFDASVLQIFSSLLMGGALVVISEEGMKDPLLMHRTLLEENVTHTMIAPVILQNLPREPLPAMKVMGYGGDVLEEQTAQYWSRQTRLFTLYGPTETTVMSSAGHIPPGGNHRVIGKTLPGYTMYLLNRLRQPVPFGAIGEICIGGPNMARGYLNRPDTTIERFISDPFSPSTYSLMYSSGDLGRFLPDGTIEFFGRNDSQIKLRGFRIELGEIESCLEKYPGILQVVCAVKGEGEGKYLAAYYRADTELDADVMRSHAGGFLPEYMVPTFFVRIDEIPSSPSGKVDRKALPEVSGTVSTNPPHNGLERQIADIWEDILRYRGIDRDTSFFRVGGNSLLAVRMLSEIKKTLGLSVSISAFYAAPTIEALARGHEENGIELAVRDAQQRLIIENPAPSSTLTAEPRTVLLTGARGFLGIYLLRELTTTYDRVYCLLRAATPEEGIEQLRKRMHEAGISIDLDKVRVVLGDLALAHLGLDAATLTSLAADVDVILHCGAMVHHLHSYATMKPANVDSTRFLLELALTTKRKHFCFVSTESVATAITGITVSREEIIDNRPAIDNGYILTKWTAEQLVASCSREYGLSAVIARAGNITGDSSSGYSNYHNNHFWMFTKGCWQLGTFPVMPATIEMTPVDVLARSICSLSVGAQHGLLVANLSNPNTMSWDEFFALLSQHGISASGEDWRVWQSRLDAIDASNGLSQIKDFYTGDLSQTQIPVEHSLTTAALRKCGIDTVSSYPRWIATYVEYLKRERCFAL